MPLCEDGRLAAFDGLYADEEHATMSGSVPSGKASLGIRNTLSRNSFLRRFVGRSSPITAAAAPALRKSSADLLSLPNMSARNSCWGGRGPRDPFVQAGDRVFRRRQLVPQQAQRPPMVLGNLGVQDGVRVRLWFGLHLRRHRDRLQSRAGRLHHFHVSRAGFHPMYDCG
jgi:hypothetical protein